MITLDFSKRQSLKVWAKEYDTARELNVQCIKDYVPIDITNCIITLNALKKDGTYIYNNGEIQDATNGKVTIPMTNQLLAVVGEVKADVSIYYPNGTILTSSSFTFDIDETIRNDEAIESSSEFTELTKAIIAESNRVLAENGRVSAEQTRVNNETIRNNAENIRVDNESDRISAESGRVTAENNRVSAETARVNAETARQIGYATMDGRINSLKDNLKEIGSSGNEILNLAFERGGISASTGEEISGNNRLRSDYIECNEDTFIIDPTDGYTVNVYQFDPEYSYIKNNGYTEDSIVVKHTGFIRFTIGQTSNFPGNVNDGYAKILRTTNLEKRLSAAESSIEYNDEYIESLTDFVLSGNVEVPVNYVSGNINYETGASTSDTTKCRSKGFISFSDADKLIILTKPIAKVSLRFFSTAGGGTFLVGLPRYYTGVVDVKKIAEENSIVINDTVMLRIIISYQDDRKVASIEELAGCVKVLNARNEEFKNLSLIAKGTNSVPTMSIRCAKEILYNDGTPPKIEWYLVEDVVNQKFYKTKDFVTYKHLFTFNAPRNSFYYKFGITKNDNIIAVFRTESLANISTHSDEVRENPYVLLANEEYKEIHEVDFGSDIKPSGWLLNVGFTNLPSGETIFCEYTRPSVATANVWVLSGDITDSSNWQVTKSFELSGDTSDGFKHCHCVMYDFFTDIVYVTTGDDVDGAQVWYSTDHGDTWAQLSPPNPADNEKYCRLLNYTFTKDYIYWASDTSKAGKHYIFRTVRQMDGVLDYSNITDLKLLPSASNGQATYGTVHIPELDMLFLSERCDGNDVTSMPVRAYIISTNELLTLGTIETADGAGHYLGFRTEYTEYYPEDLKIKFGFGARFSMGDYSNSIKGFGNTANASPNYNVNNLYLTPYKNADGTFSFRLGTYY